eukprot:TRINITY_DN1220_c0_g1_i1.p1 TRINITY_DN1220_c0_g1~~TRINITY_DN1220_c0_g1_i1.p1  ORF type:complete len:126 (+),score=28.73 TRINITY_DN1220_c0_g1_i1:49-426(+)
MDKILGLSLKPRLLVRSSVPPKTSYFARNGFISGRSFGTSALLDKQEVTDRVVNIVKNFHKVGRSKDVTSETHFANDLGLDSLDTVEVVMAFEDEFCIDIPDAEADKIQSVGDAIKYILTNPQAK